MALDRVLATVLFTDVAGSTETAARLGDRAWRTVIADHDRIVRGQLAGIGAARWRERETASWPPSTGLHAVSVARLRS